MNDRRQKREDDDEGGLDFELRTHRIERRRKIGINSPGSLEHPRLNKDNQDQGHSPLNRHPYNVIFESSCKLHPTGSYSSQFDLSNSYPQSNKYSSHQFEVSDAHFSNTYCNDMYFSKCHTSPPPPQPPPLTLPPSSSSPSPHSMPSVTAFSQPPTSPRVYFQKPPYSIGHPPMSPMASSPPPLPPTLASAPSSRSLSNMVPRIVRPTPQGTLPSDVNQNPPLQIPKVTEINVLLKNHVVICLEVEDAQTATCRDLLAMIFEEPEVGLPHEAEDVFALWLVSPLFEVQLKPDHRPLQVCKKWLELLAKYTTANITQRENDFPYLSLQRDVFFSKQEEMRLSNSVALELLYEEAKQNVLCGRYPCDQNTAERMAGMQARIELGKYDHDIHTPAFFKSRLDTFLPPYACKTKRSFFNFGSKTSLEYKLLILFRGLQDDVSPHTIMRQYLEFCWNLPCYGSAFFAGQLEKPAHGLAALIGYQDMPVTVAINSEGVSILSPAEGEVVLGLRYQELSWDSARPVQENNPDCLPCLFLQFQVLEDGQRVFKVLQVFSKQAILMDAIISSFVRALRRHSWDRDEVDDNSATSPGDCTPDADDAQTPLTTSSLYDSTSNDADTFLPSKLQQLSLATFNEDGDCIKLMGSWAFR